MTKPALRTAPDTSSDPLDELRRVADALASGDTSVRGAPTGDEEVDPIILTLNRFMGKLEYREVFHSEAERILNQKAQVLNLTVSQSEAEKEQIEQARRQLDRIVRDRTAELVASNQALKHSNRELDDFAYIASHDLKEPLRGIHNYAAFLLEDYGDKLDDDGRKKLETLPRLAARLEALLNSLLWYSRIGRTDLAFKETCLQKVVEEVRESLQISIEEQGIDLRIPRPMPTVRCDSARVSEVFRNLISNGIKYCSTNSGQKWIEVGCQDGTPMKGPVFYVKDNGIGIREKHQEVVFKIFKRLHAKGAHGGGTGSGLTIAKKIVERHNGRMWIESQYGEGTTFFFTLDRGGS